MSTYNRICSLSRVTDFIFPKIRFCVWRKHFYNLQIRQHTKNIYIMKILSIFHIISRQINIFKRAHFHHFYENSAFVNGIQKIFIQRKAISLLHKIDILCINYYIEVKAYHSPTKRNFLADLLSYNQYILIANKLFSLLINQIIFKVVLKNNFEKIFLNRYQLV